MARYEYDEEVSQQLHMDVVYEIDDRPTPVARWVEAMRRLNSINDPLARRILALHRDCGSGSGACDSGFEDEPIARQVDWGLRDHVCDRSPLRSQLSGGPAHVRLSASIRRVQTIVSLALEVE